MRRYETIYILRPNLGEEEITKVIENTNEIILGDKGIVIELNKWGMKKLAYLIKKETQGYYVYCDYAGTPAAVAEIERKFRIDDSVLKYMTIKTAAAISDEQIQLAVSEVSTRETEAQAAEAAEEEVTPEKPTEPNKVSSETTEEATPEKPTEPTEPNKVSSETTEEATGTE